jgi:DNA-binding NtrC family response regulator
MKKILIVDDNTDLLMKLRQYLIKKRYRVAIAENSKIAYQKIKTEKPDIVILDIYLNEAKSGLDILRTIRKTKEIKPPTIYVFTSNPDEATCKRAIVDGANDYIVKYNDARKIAQVILEKLEPEIPPFPIETTIIGSQRVVMEWIAAAYKVAKAESDAFILGAPGTGKKLTAQIIQAHSKKKIITVDCRQSNSQSIHIELFGYEEGTVHGPKSRSVGRIEEARSGILCFQEIGAIPHDCQQAILDLLLTKQYRKYGGTKQYTFDGCMLFTNSQNLEGLVAQERLQESLFVALQKIAIRVPSLNEYRADVPKLAKHFVTIGNAMYKKKVKDISDKAIAYLEKQTWENNVLSLKMKVIETVREASEPVLDLRDFQEVETESTETFSEIIGIDHEQHRVFVDQQEVKLRPVEFKLLDIFKRNNGRALGREAITDSLDSGITIDEKTINSHVMKLRKKLGKYSSAIETVTGVGYRYIDPVRE